jgi:hypothetical protein
MSPIIATMLLIAFAVALGAMIINLSTSIGEKETGPDCSKVLMEISPYLCYADNLIKISIKNSGDPIESVTMKVSDANTENSILIKDSKMAKGVILKKEIPYVKAGKTYVGLIPSIMNKDQPVPCPIPAIEEADIPNC